MMIWPESFIGRIVSCAIQSAIVVGFFWLVLVLGCSKGIITCIEVDWQTLAIAFGIGFAAFFMFYDRFAIRLRHAKYEHRRKYGSGYDYFGDNG